MNRIEQTLAALQEKNEKAFITYITAGLPDYTKTKELIKAQEQAGTDIIELGIPFSDPVADGPVIQEASYQAILGGANLEKTFTCMQEMRGDPDCIYDVLQHCFTLWRGKIRKKMSGMWSGWPDYTGPSVRRAG